MSLIRYASELSFTIPSSASPGHIGKLSGPLTPGQPQETQVHIWSLVPCTQAVGIIF